MIKGATTFINEFTKEEKQKCECGAIHPIHHNQCWSCGRGMKAFENVIDWNKVEGINRTYEETGGEE